MMRAREEGCRLLRQHPLRMLNTLYLLFVIVIIQCFFIIVREQEDGGDFAKTLLATRHYIVLYFIIK
jgi:hypothetical protein